MKLRIVRTCICILRAESISFCQNTYIPFRNFSKTPSPQSSVVQFDFKIMDQFLVWHNTYVLKVRVLMNTDYLIGDRHLSRIKLWMFIKQPIPKLGFQRREYMPLVSELQRRQSPGIALSGRH